MTTAERRHIPLLVLQNVIREYKLAGTDSPEPLETKCLKSVSPPAIVVQMQRVGSTENILQWRMVLLVGKFVITGSVGAVWSQITSMCATAQRGSTFTNFNQRLHAIIVIVAMEYQVRLGFA